MNRMNIQLFTILIFSLFSIFAGAQDRDQQTSSLIEQLRLEESDVAMRDQPRWKKPDKVYINISRFTPDSEEQKMMLEAAREVAGNVEIVPVGNKLNDDIISDVEVLISRCNIDDMLNATNLLWFQHSAHGVDDCIAPETIQKDFVLTNAQHTSGPPISEHTIAMMMMMSRGLIQLHSAQINQTWNRRAAGIPIIEIKGKTLLVAGLGGIGTAVAHKANALGMRVLATRNSSREGPDFVEYVGLSHEIYELAKQADFVVNTLPLTDDTRGLFDNKFFNAVKKGAYYINVGRGETTVHPDLIAALKDGRLTAAGLDVTAPEPLPGDHELWTLPNIIITPHIAALTDQGRWRRWLVVRENLRRYINGDKLLNVVNKELGY
ncbi:MAG: D-2-hydroxyacid dehydrogenase [Gammaproteobacteria bacterium]|nr:D-2-hydroxyacid dehydrogenase [Gammaproteobacteria bacterium]